MKLKNKFGGVFFIIKGYHMWGMNPNYEAGKYSFFVDEKTRELEFLEVGSICSVFTKNGTKMLLITDIRKPRKGFIIKKAREKYQPVLRITDYLRKDLLK